MTTITNTSYDFSTDSDYLNRKMFLDEAGPVTVQRFEEVKYSKLQKYEATARGFFWQPEEITLVKDKQDFKEATEAIRHIFTSNIIRQTALDSIQGRAPAQIFIPVISIPELETLVTNWTFYEGNIHSNSYSWLIRNIYSMPREEFNRIHSTPEIVEMAASVGKYYNELHDLNCMKRVHELFPELAQLKVSTKKHKKAIWMALHTSYALEALRFMVSFATSLAMVENKIFIGNGNIISLILQDELLHAEWTAWIINQLPKDDPDFAQIKIECAREVYEMYLSVISEEKNWAKYLFKKGVVIGLNTAILSDFMDWTAFNALKEIGIKYDQPHPRSSPIPWFNKHVQTNKKQTALQENESTSYIIGVLSDTVNHDELPDL